MGFLKSLFASKEKYNKKCNNYNLKSERNFNEIEYKKYNDKKIEEFKKLYDLSSIDGIQNIPVQVTEKYSDGGKSVVYMPEQILNRQATEYKKNKNFILAIECLKKANELYPTSFYHYTRDNYERVVDMMVLAKNFDEAKQEHKRLDKLYGTRLAELKELQKTSNDIQEYETSVIVPYTKECKEREQYYWLLENLPRLAPKSFGGYRRMKEQKSENYQKISLEVSNMGEKVENLKFWI